MSDITQILEDLAAGRIDAAEAARIIDEHSRAPQSDGAAQAGADPRRAATSGDAESAGRPQYTTHGRESFRREPEPEPTSTQAQPDPAPAAAEVNLDDVPESGASAQARAAGSKGVDRIVVRATGRRVRIIADPKVATVSAEGPHVLRRTGKVLEVTSDGDLGPSLDGFSIVRPPKSWEDLRSGVGLGKALTLRVNPAIAIDAEVTAGSLKITDVPLLGKIRVTAGSATLVGVNEIADALVQAGSASVSGAIQSGRSRVRVESGSLSVRLDEGANVTIKGDSQLGRVSWPVEGSVDEYVVGNGSARLDIGVVMGHASIKVADEASDDQA